MAYLEWNEYKKNKVSLGELATYLTLKNQSEGLYKEKGSKYIGLAVACYNEEEVKQKLEMWKQIQPSSVSKIQPFRDKQMIRNC